MVAKTKQSQPPKPITDKQRADDEKLMRELEHPDPGIFKRLIKPLFRSSKTKD
jgi:hypothetical protein